MTPKTTNEVIAEFYPSVMQDVIDASLVDFEDAGISSAILYELQSLWQKALSGTRVGPFPWDPPVRSVKSEVNIECDTAHARWIEQQRGQHSMSTLTEAQLCLLTPLEQFRAKLESHNENLKYAQETARQKAEELANQRAKKFVEQMRKTSYADEIKEEGGAERPYLEDEAAIVAELALMEGPTVGNIGRGGEGAATYIEQVENGANQQMGIFYDPNTSGLTSSLHEDTTHDGTLENLNFSSIIKNEFLDFDYPVLPNLPEYKDHPMSQDEIPQLDGDSELNDGGPELNDGGSELNDDNEELNDGDDEDIGSAKDEFEDVQELCVCLYDKVVRNRGKVSHKWKCSLRDGVLIAGGKEYPFGKATAEFIW